MTRTGICVLMLIAACGKGSSGDAAKVDISVDHVAAVNAAIPAEWKGKIEFVAGEIVDDKRRNPVRYKVAIPKDWKKGFMPGALEPADSDTFGSKTFGKTEIQVGSNCDGTCEKKDWAATSDKVNFAQFATGQTKGKVIKDEKSATGRTMVFEHEVDSSFPEKEVAVRIIRAWWTDGAPRYYTCTADLGTPAKGLAAAFEKACSKVSGQE